jgi:hypothetical protein
MTKNIKLEINPTLADNLLAYADMLSNTFGIQGYGPDAALYHLKMHLEQGKLVLEQEQAKELAKLNKPAYNIVMCPIPKDSNNHDCWILDKKTKTIYYAPHGHHYAIVQYLHTNYPGVIDQMWAKSDTVQANIRTGDVKSGNPRTAKENPVTMKKLRSALVKCYYDARGQEVPPHML